MISVQNLLRPSSGNNSIITLLVLVFLLTACGGTDKAVSQNKRNQKTTSSSKGKVTDVKKKKKVKEIDWTEATDESKPPIKASKNASSSEDESEILATIDKEEMYDLTYFIPFKANSYVGSSNASDRFVQYYAGMQVAARILEKEGVNLNVNVVDEKKRRFDDILEAEVNRNTDVIVGPYDRSDLKTAAQYAKEKRIPIVSPWQASSKIAKDNPYYIQLRPNLDEHYFAIFNDIKDTYEREQVYIIGRNTNNKDVKRIKKLQRMARDVWDIQESEILQEELLIQDSIDFGVTAFDSVFTMNKPSVFVIPNWSFEDEAFIYGALRRLSVEKGLSKVVVYGMPIMLESEKINFDYYSSLQMKVARSKFVDEGDYDVNRFKRDFVNEFGALPTDDAYEGYDNLMYIGRNLHEYGKNFQYYLHKDQGYYLQAGYKVTPTREDGLEESGKIKYFENKNVDIIEFENARFKRNLE